MALRPANGQNSWERNDWTIQAIQDGVYSRPVESTPPTGAPSNIPSTANSASYSSSYTEAYAYGQWFALQLRRNAI